MSDSPVRGPIGRPGAPTTTPNGRVTRVDYKAIQSNRGSDEGKIVGQVTVAHVLGQRFVASLHVPASAFRFVEANGSKPDHWHARIMGVDIHLREGVKPSQLGDTPLAIEVKVREVKATTGAKRPEYVYINAFPADGAESQESVHIGHTPPAGNVVQSWKKDAPGTIFLINAAPAAA